MKMENVYLTVSGMGRSALPIGLDYEKVVYL